MSRRPPSPPPDAPARATTAGAGLGCTHCSCDADRQRCAALVFPGGRCGRPTTWFSAPSDRHWPLAYCAEHAPGIIHLAYTSKV